MTAISSFEYLALSRGGKMVDVTAVRWRCSHSLRRRRNQWCDVNVTTSPLPFQPLGQSVSCIPLPPRRGRLPPPLLYRISLLLILILLLLLLLLRAPPSSSSSPSHHEFGVRRAFRTDREPAMCFRFVTLMEVTKHR